MCGRGRDAGLLGHQDLFDGLKKMGFVPSVTVSLCLPSDSCLSIAFVYASVLVVECASVQRQVTTNTSHKEAKGAASEPVALARASGPCMVCAVIGLSQSTCRMLRVCRYVR